MYWIIGGFIVVAIVIFFLFLNHNAEKESYDYKKHF